MKIEDFVSTPEIITIFQSYNIVEFRDLVFTLELYKFLPQASIIETINQSEEFEETVFSIDKANREVSFEKEEKKFQVIISKQSDLKLRVIFEVGTKVNKDGLELALDMYEIEYLAVTPYNYKTLLEPDKKWEVFLPMILFKRILLEGIAVRATDLHFCVEHDGLKPVYPVKYRKDGNLYKMDLFTLTEDLNRRIISELIESGTDSNSLDLITPAGVVTVADDPLNNQALELRIAANKVKGGWQCVIRLQQKETFHFEIKNLGFSEDVQEALQDLVTKRTGIVFITGAIRTGKNTTAFAVLNEIVKEPVKILSYESPIEVLMPFTQVDYHGDTDVLLNAVRLAKKQDVNVAYLNELPNKEVAFAVQDLVNSSIYVLTTMHMDRLWHLPYKLKNYYGEEYKDVLSQINTVFNQKMFGVPCPECKSTVLVETLKPKWCEFLKKNGIHHVEVSSGCPFCGDTGLIHGRNQPYVEYLVFTPELKEKLLECEQPFQMEAILKKEIMGRQVSLEFRMSDAIASGNLAVDALNFIL